MIEKAEKEYTKEEIDSALDPIIKKWFYSNFRSFSPPQKYAVMEIHKGRNVLISSPTGTGKTLSGFLSIINELFILGRNQILNDHVYAVYVSPLKALSNDIEKNLNQPLKEIYELAEKEGIKVQKIRVAKRTGDTSPKERASHLKKPPHIYITTPESLAIVLNSPKLVQHFRRIRWILIDEVHALADNKRGVHLSLSLERLEYHLEAPATRIGLSATIHPLEEVAKFLAGYKNNEPRDCLIVDISFLKETDLKVISPVPDLIYAPTETLHAGIYTTLDKLISSQRTSLIFTNTRSGTERVVHNLKERFPEKYRDSIEAHHGSLSKTLRMSVEDRLKKGELKAVVCSTSLELGIDIGYIDQVLLISSPKSVTRLLQRIGRSGHKLHDKAKGRVLVVDRDDLVECTILAQSALESFLDRVQISMNALDVLAQHLVGMSLEKKWELDEAFEVVKRAYCYHSLEKKDFMSVLGYLAGEYAGLEDRSVYAKLWLDRDNSTFGKKGRNIRMIYYTNIGTIPDESSAKIRTSDGQYLGGVEESFLEKLRKGDRFVLGGQVYEFRYARGMTGQVTPAYDKLPTIPSWFSEMLPLSFDSAMRINSFRYEMRELIKGKKDYVIKHLTEKYGLEKKTAGAIYSYFREQSEFLGIPTANEIIIEDYIDELARQNIIFHTLFGRRVNDALSRAYAYAMSRIKKANIRVSITDNGFVLTMPSVRRANIKDIVSLVDDENIEELLARSLEGTEILKRRFRHVATRSLLVLRSYKGRKKTVGRQKMSSFFLYHALKKTDPDFPVIKETFREIMEDAMDIKNAKLVLRKIKEHKSRFVMAGKKDVPSPFAHNIILAGSSDAIMMENKRELLKLLHKQVLRRIESGEN